MPDVNQDKGWNREPFQRTPASDMVQSEVQQPCGRTPMEQPRSQNKIRTVTIRQLDHGYLVDVGCQCFAIQDWSILIGKLALYLQNPDEIEKKHLDGKLFS